MKICKRSKIKANYKLAREQKPFWQTTNKYVTWKIQLPMEREQKSFRPVKVKTNKGTCKQ